MSPKESLAYAMEEAELLDMMDFVPQLSVVEGRPTMRPHSNDLAEGSQKRFLIQGSVTISF